MNNISLEVSKESSGEKKMSAQAMVTDSTVAQIALLHRISGIVSSDQDLESMLNELVGLIVQVTDCDACLVYLADHAKGEIVLRASPALPHKARNRQLANEKWGKA